MGKTKLVSFGITKQLYQDKPSIKEKLPAILSERAKKVGEKEEVKSQNYFYTYEVDQNVQIDIQSVLSSLRKQNIKAKLISQIKKMGSDEEYLLAEDI